MQKRGPKPRLRELFRCRPPFPLTKNFIVFFDLNKSNLTADALAILQDAVKTAKSGGVDDRPRPHSSSQESRVCERGKCLAPDRVKEQRSN
jgi:hypothetical protein